MSTDLAVAPKSDLQKFLESRINEITSVCSHHVSPARIVSLVNVLAYKNPDLLKCTKDSILSSVLQASALGFDLSPSAGEAYLIPRWNKNINGFECQFQPGYQGLVKLALQSGKVNIVQAVLVHAKDHFEINYSPEVQLMHKPCMDEVKGPITQVYAWAKLSTGERLIEVMSIAEVMAIAARSQGKGGGPWKTDLGEMVKKTVVRRLCKMLPKTPALVQAIEAHDTAFGLTTDDEPKKIAVDNNTGVGSGKYAAPDHQKIYMNAISGYVEKRNQQWLDRWTGPGGEIPDKLQPHLCTIAQADDYLTEFAEEVGMLEPGSRPEGGIKAAQVGRLASIPFNRSQDEQKKLKIELKNFIDAQEASALKALQEAHPELFQDETTEDSWEEGETT